MTCLLSIPDMRFGVKVILFALLVWSISDLASRVFFVENPGRMVLPEQMAKAQNNRLFRRQDPAQIHARD
jgi:hypothetical protein